MKMDNLTYEKYNDKSLHVKGDKDKYSAIIKKLGGRWNGRLKKGAGWLVPIDKEEELKSLIRDLFPQKDETEAELETIQTSAKSRKEQKKYHRAVSRPTSESEEDEEVKQEKTEKLKQRKKSKKLKKTKKPPTPVVVPSSSSSSDSSSDESDEGLYNRSMSRSSSDSSSTSSSSSSSDDFPAHSYPKETDRYAKIATKVKDMQRAIYDLDLKTRKRQL